MSLFGALFSGVSGLGAQGTSMGVIADNITNISTIGYKTTQTNFKTLVTVASTASSYAPGGVQAAPQQLIDRQGLLQSSVSPTDLAINGNGFFVVNELASPTATQGSYLYSRAGSFTKDESGNLKNSAGFFLQGWPVNAATGLIPSNRSDLTELNTVNIEGIAGTASKTSTVALQANLKASQAVTATLPTDVTTLAALPPTDDLTTAPASLAAGTTIVITTGGSTVNATFTLAAAPASAATNNFNTLTELAALINSTNGLSATIGGTSTAATLTVKGPADETMTVAGTAAATLFGAASTVTAATYLASTATTNMASAAITPDFERSVAVFDSKGGSHTLTFGFLKNTPANEWLVEVYIEPSSEIDAAAANGQGLNGLIAARYNKIRYRRLCRYKRIHNHHPNSDGDPHDSPHRPLGGDPRCRCSDSHHQLGDRRHDRRSDAIRRRFESGVDHRQWRDLRRSRQHHGLRPGGRHRSVRERCHEGDLPTAGRYVLERCRPPSPQRQRLPGDGPFRNVQLERGQHRRIRPDRPVDIGILHR